MKNQLPRKFLPFIWHFLQEYKTVSLVYTMIALAAGFWGPFNSILIKQIIDLLPSAREGDISILILPASLIVLNFIVFGNLTWMTHTYIRAKYISVVVNNIISKLMNHCLGESQQFYQNNLSGKISKQITNLADGIEQLLGGIVSNFLKGASLLITAFIAAYFVNPIFCYILLTWFIVFAAISILMSKRLVLLADSQASAESIVVGELVDCLSNHSNVRIFSNRTYENSRMHPFFGKQQKAYRATYFYSLIMDSIQGGLIAVMMGFSIYFLIHLYGKNLVTVGDFALILGLSIETGHQMWFTMSQVNEFNKAVGKCKQSLSSLILPPSVRDKPDAPGLEYSRGQIVFRSVGFHYKGTEALFENLNIEIKGGQKVGLVGYSGSGKTSFANLILRLYDVNGGAILIDGRNIRDVTQDSLRENIAMIPQDPSLFHRSIMDNIRYGRTDASDAEVIAAAKCAHAHEFIEKLPAGYESLVGERGVKLSGGQRQRIAIARAILKNAPILILDEATSALDSVTENLIQESLLELMNSNSNDSLSINASFNENSRTTIVIAHRLSTLSNMDRILVFHKGKIIEDGTHNELLQSGGHYKELWDAQVGGLAASQKADKDK